MLRAGSGPRGGPPRGERSMSARAVQVALPRTRSHVAPAPESLALRMVAFFALAAFASVQYMTLLLHPPGLRVVAVAAIATAGGAALALSARVARPAAAASLLRGPLMLLTLAVGLIAIGVPAHLLAPGRWPALSRDLHHGFDGLTAWLWPYRGGEGWSRLTVLVVLPFGLATAAGLSFWPSQREPRARRLAALSVLIAIFLAGVANETGAAWRVQGIVLLLLIAAWLWLPRLRAADVPRAGRWLLACVVGALALAPTLSAGRPWIDYHAWNPLAVATTFQWDQLYGPIPWSRSTATMFEVTESRPQLLRVTSLDRFDGVRFLRSEDPPGSPSLDLGQFAGGRWYARATVTVSGLRSSMLVSGGGVPVAVNWLGASRPTAIGQPDGTAELSPALSSGGRYSVLSYAPTPSAAVLREVPARFPKAYLPYTQFELPGPAASGLLQPDLRAEALEREPAARLVGAPAPGISPASDPALARRIGDSPYGPMFALARNLAAGARSSYDVVERLERFLLASYSYDERPPRRRYPLESFLFEDRAGYCQQFSGAMALMLRMDGIPARVAVGFRPGVFDPVTGAWRVRALDAHSWVEVYFSGIGWVPFDPTPPAAALSPGRLGLPSKALFPASPGPGVQAGARQPVVPASGSLRPRAQAGPSPWPLAVAGSLLLLALILAGRWISGARRLRAALAGDASGAVGELWEALARVGYRFPPGTTLMQLEQQLASGRCAAASRYLRRLREVRYGVGQGVPPTPRERRELRRALGAGGGIRARLRALMALPPGAARRVRPTTPTRS